jgi:hypothetical protein
LDAGIASDDNIKWLKENGYPYIVVSRKRHRQFNEDEAIVVKQDKNCTVKAQKVIDSENDEVLLYCHSTQREKKEQAINDRFTVRFEDALKHLETGLHIKGRLKKYDKVIEKIGRQKQKYFKASKLYKIDVSKDKKMATQLKLIGFVTPSRIQKMGFQEYIALEPVTRTWMKINSGEPIQC